MQQPVSILAGFSCRFWLIKIFPNFKPLISFLNIYDSQVFVLHPCSISRLWNRCQSVWLIRLRLQAVVSEAGYPPEQIPSAGHPGLDFF